MQYISHSKTIKAKSKTVISKNDRLASDSDGCLEKQYDLSVDAVVETEFTFVI